MQEWDVVCINKAASKLQTPEPDRPTELSSSIHLISKVITYRALGSLILSRWTISWSFAFQGIPRDLALLEIQLSRHLSRMYYSGCCWFSEWRQVLVVDRWYWNHQTITNHPQYLIAEQRFYSSASRRRSCTFREFYPTFNRLVSLLVIQSHAVTFTWVAAELIDDHNKFTNVLPLLLSIDRRLTLCWSRKSIVINASAGKWLC